jgi:hypothetical protein
MQLRLSKCYILRPIALFLVLCLFIPTPAIAGNNDEPLAAWQVHPLAQPDDAQEIEKCHCEAKKTALTEAEKKEKEKAEDLKTAQSNHVAAAWQLAAAKTDDEIEAAMKKFGETAEALQKAVEALTNAKRDVQDAKKAVEECEKQSCPRSKSALPLELVAFSAELSAGSVTLSWETASEADNVGFNLYRHSVSSGLAVKLNEAPIAAQGSAESGASYEFLDQPEPGHVTYEIRNIDQNGEEHLRGQLQVGTQGVMIFIPMLARQ